MGFGRALGNFAKGFQSGYETGWKGRLDKNEWWKTRPNPYTQGDDVPGYQPGTGTVPTGVPQVSTDSDKTGSTTGGSGGTMPNAGGKAIGQQIYDYYRSKGLTHAAAAGITGNFLQESGGDPRVIGGHRRGDGGASGFVGQWNGRRLQNLYKFAGSQQPTLQQQLDFALAEMDPNSPFVDAQAAKAAPAIYGAKSPEEAATLFRQHFERPSANDVHNRIKYANSFGDSGGGGTGGPAPYPYATTEQGVGSQYPADASGMDLPHRNDDPREAEAQDETANVGGAIEIPELIVQEQIEPPLLPMLGYAEGGAIPDPTTTNASRFYANVPGEWAGSGAQGSFKSKLKLGSMPISTGPTESQMVWRNRPKPQPVQAAPAAAVQQPTYHAPTALQTSIARQKNMMYGQPWEGERSKGHQISQQRKLSQLQKARKDEFARLGYAEGGKVAKEPKADTFASRGYRLKKKQGQGPVGRRPISSRSADAGYTTSAPGWRGDSSAIFEREYFRPKKSKAKAGVGKADHQRPRSGGGGGGGDRTSSTEQLRQPAGTPFPERMPAGTPTSPYEPQTEFSPDLPVSPNRPDNRPATNAPTNNPPTWASKSLDDIRQPERYHLPGSDVRGDVSRPAPIGPMSTPHEPIVGQGGPLGGGKKTVLGGRPVIVFDDPDPLPEVPTQPQQAQPQGSYADIPIPFAEGGIIPDDTEYETYGQPGPGGATPQAPFDLVGQAPRRPPAAGKSPSKPKSKAKKKGKGKTTTKSKRRPTSSATSPKPSTGGFDI